MSDETLVTVDLSQVTPVAQSVRRLVSKAVREEAFAGHVALGPDDWTDLMYEVSATGATQSFIRTEGDSRVIVLTAAGREVVVRCAPKQPKDTAAIGVTRPLGVEVFS
jgi:hypothetical protein